MMNRSPSQDGSVGDLDSAGPQLSFSLAMEPIADPWRVASLQDGHFLRLRFEAADSWSGLFASPERLDWTGSRTMLLGSDLQLSAAFSGLTTGGVTKSHGEEPPPPPASLLGANLSEETGSDLAATISNTPPESNGALNQAIEQAAQDTEISGTFRLLAERPRLTLPQMVDAPQGRIPDGSKGLPKPLLDEIFDHRFIVHFPNMGSVDAVWNAW